MPATTFIFSYLCIYFRRCDTFWSFPGRDDPAGGSPVLCHPVGWFGYHLQDGQICRSSFSCRLGSQPYGRVIGKVSLLVILPYDKPDYCVSRLLRFWSIATMRANEASSKKKVISCGFEIILGVNKGTSFIQKNWKSRFPDYENYTHCLWKIKSLSCETNFGFDKCIDFGANSKTVIKCSCMQFSVSHFGIKLSKL